MISLVLGGALSSLIEPQERMDSIASLFAAKASDVDALARTWRRRLRRRREVGGAGHAIPVLRLAAGRGGTSTMALTMITLIGVSGVCAGISYASEASLSDYPMM